MKLKIIGRAALALAASAVSLLGMTSCTLSYTVGYFFVTGAATGAGTQFGQIASYRIQNNTGQLRQSSIVGSAGVNPIQIAVNPSGTYLYVLNAGCGDLAGQTACPSGGNQASQIDQFSIGGRGVLTHQQTFFPQGTNTVSMQLSGNFLYTLDQYAPGDSTGTVQKNGDISAFGVDPVTGRLSTILNQQARDSNNLLLTYFPVGTNPTWLALSGSNAFAAEQGPATNATPNDPAQAIFIYALNPSNGQLTLTQSTPTPTGATQLTYIYVNAATLYALDAGPTGSAGRILPYTIGASGGLQAVTGGARDNNAQGSTPVLPLRIIRETSKNFLWVANSGINTGQDASAGVITAYVLNSTGQLADANTGTANNITSGTSPRCIVEDPSNQYVYTVNFNDSTITGKKINFGTGGLDGLPKPLPAPPGSPTWCAVTGSTF